MQRKKWGATIFAKTINQIGSTAGALVVMTVSGVSTPSPIHPVHILVAVLPPALMVFF